MSLREHLAGTVDCHYGESTPKLMPAKTAMMCQFMQKKKIKKMTKKKKLPTHPSAPWLCSVNGVNFYFVRVCTCERHTNTADVTHFNPSLGNFLTIALSGQPTVASFAALGFQC